MRDDRLRLIFTCCHPALSDAVQVALTLRLLGGLTTAEIARAFLVPEATMAQRLVRAKGKIRDARIPYRIPGEADLPGRVRKALTLAPELKLHVERTRALHFPQAVFWFEASFVSDQKEQEIIPVALDLHYARQVRHLEQLLDHVTNDKLVRWGWDPGDGRTKPPLAHAEFARKFRDWVEKGAASPE